MNINVIKKIAGILVVAVMTGNSLFGQTRNDVIKYYNDGAKAAQTDIPAAIAAFENVVDLSDKVGETAADLKEKAVKVLPGLYFKVAYNMLNEKKPASEIIKASRKAMAASEKYGNAANKENSGKVLIQAYNIMATDFFSKNDTDKALVTFDSLLAINPDFLPAVYNKALIYRSKNDAPGFESTIDAYIGKLDPAKDADKLKQASGMALEYFRAAGSQANQAEKLDDALAMLTKASKYGEDKDLYYYFADVYNKQKNFDSGAENAQKGLALESGNAEAKAKFYFQLALAQAGKGQKTEACASFKNAMCGPFAAPSKAQRTNLKCE